MFYLRAYLIRKEVIDKMRILITGAFGNLGLKVIDRLLKQEHDVTCFDIKNKKNLKTSKKFKDINTVWGDIRDINSFKKAVEENDIIIHLAFVIPPLSEKDPDIAWDINVEGTRNIIEAIKSSNAKKRLIFTSSISVYGTSSENPPRKITDPVQPTDSYSHHKVVCEHLIRISNIDHCILRLGAVLSIDLCELDPLLYKVPIDKRIELVHIEDAALAVVNSISNKKATNKTLLIGGGNSCQMLQRDFIKKVLKVVGVGMLPPNAFSIEAFYTDWMDTNQSQAILQYQEKDLDDYIEDLKKALGFKRHFVKIFQPIVRYTLLKKSPFMGSARSNTKTKTKTLQKNRLSTS